MVSSFFSHATGKFSFTSERKSVDLGKMLKYDYSILSAEMGVELCHARRKIKSRGLHYLHCKIVEIVKADIIKVGYFLVAFSETFFFVNKVIIFL